MPELNLDDIIDAFEEERSRDGQVALDRFLPEATHADFAAIAGELIRVDLEYSYAEKTPRSLDLYQQKYPGVFECPVTVAGIAFEDYRLRLQSGLEARPEDYARRFQIDVSQWSLQQSTPAPDESKSLLSDAIARAQDSAVVAEIWAKETDTKFRTASDLSELKTLHSGETFLDFEIISKLGEGANGLVFLAKQPALANRLVVLKVAHASTIEADRLAQLQHTNIVPIYSNHHGGNLMAFCMPFLGTAMLRDWVHCLGEGVPTSGHVDGFLDCLSSRRSKATANWPARIEHVNGEQIQPAESFGSLRKHESYINCVLEIMSQVADGLAHAHEHGILHRDLKPDNILLTDTAQPLLLDFHLAVQFDQPEASEAKRFVGGTIPYMSPEQLRSLDSGEELGPASDIFSMGVILYEMLTGEVPFSVSKGVLSDVVKAAIEARVETPNPRQLNRVISPATAAIVGRCLNPDPEKRYTSAAALAQDLRCQLNDRPLKHAGNPSVAERGQKWLRRNPWSKSIGFLVTASLMLIATLSTAVMHQLARINQFTAIEQQQLLVEQHPEVSALLSDPVWDGHSEAASHRLGMEKASQLLENFHVLSDADWKQSSPYRDLPQEFASSVDHAVGEILYLMAASISESHADSALEQAVAYNKLAQSAFGEKQIPQALKQQQIHIEQKIQGGSPVVPSVGEMPSAANGKLDQILLATGLMIDGELSQAQGLFEEVQKASPRDFLTTYRLGLCVYGQKEMEQAEQYFTNCILLMPDSALSYYRRGVCRIALKKFASASEDFSKTLEITPERTAALVSRALAYDGMQEYQLAIDDLSQAIKKGFPETRIYFIRARVYEKLDQFELAQKDFEEGLQRNPQDAISFVSRGIAQMESDPQAALADMREALALNPLAKEAYRNIAYLQSEKLQQPDLAIDALNELLTFHKTDPLAWAGRGVLHARNGNRDLARSDADRVIELVEHPTALFQVGCIYALTSSTPDDTLKAIGYLGRAFRLNPALARIARTDPDLAKIQNEDKLKKLLAATRIIEAATDLAQ